MDYSEKKALAIKEYLSGGITSVQIGLKYGIGNASVSRWAVMEKKKKKNLEEYSAAIQAAKEEMPADVKALQEELRMARLNISLLEAMIDISDEQHGTDIRKKAGTRRS